MKVDRASMAVSLELRAPILDHCFMELVAVYSLRHETARHTGKYIFKKAMESLLPEEILYRPKQGFAVPLAQWFRRDLREQAYELVVANNRDGILESGFLNIFGSSTRLARLTGQLTLWTVLMFRKWQQVFQPVRCRLCMGFTGFANPGQGLAIGHSSDDVLCAGTGGRALDRPQCLPVWVPLLVWPRVG